VGFPVPAIENGFVASLLECFLGEAITSCKRLLQSDDIGIAPS